jgi:hypothetical protein
VLEVTVIGQLEFSFGFMFCPWRGREAAAGAVEMWKSGAFGFGRISKPGGKSGKLAFGF